MNSKAMTLSLVMAGIAVIFVMSSVSSIEDQANKKFGDEVTVLVAKEDIREMANITDVMIEAKQVPKNFVDPTAISFSGKVDEKSTEYSVATRRIVGNVAIVPIKKGEQLTINKITEASLKTGLAPQVAPGKRAISIAIDENSGVSKLIKPGDRIDLIAVIDTGSNAGGKDAKVAKTLFQDVVILAVGRSVTNNLARRVEVDSQTGYARSRSLTEYDGFSSVTLELDPQQAQTVAAIGANSSNKIILTLRNNDDTDRVSLSNVRAQDVLGEQSRLPASPNTGGNRQ
jgi:pilus assembly protein CpaB